MSSVAVLLALAVPAAADETIAAARQAFALFLPAG